jgi:hypothetical protein
MGAAKAIPREVVRVHGRFERWHRVTGVTLSSQLVPTNTGLMILCTITFPFTMVAVRSNYMNSLVTKVSECRK